MEFPGVQLEPGDTVERAVEKVVFACRARGEELFSIEPHNSRHPNSDACRFFQTRLDSADCFLVVMVKEWEEELLVHVINVLLEIKGEVTSAAGRIRFASLHPIPAVLGTLFGRGKVSEFECLAVPVVCFGNGLEPDVAFQVATVGMFLLREVFGLRTDFWDEDGELRLAEALAAELPVERFPADGVPLNTLVALGFLFGERQRARLGYPGRWLMLKGMGPWPCLSFTSSEANEEAADQHVTFSPVSLVLGAFQQGEPDLVREAATELAGKCRRELGPPVRQ